VRSEEKKAQGTEHRAQGVGKGEWEKGREGEWEKLKQCYSVKNSV
jgi:hypothetical protein